MTERSHAVFLSYASQDAEAALRICAALRAALVYEKLGRRADAKAAMTKIEAMQGDTAAYQYSATYAQWGDTPKALEWLESALRLRDPGLSLLKTDPLMDPLRKEPRYRAVERQLNFPE